MELNRELSFNDYFGVTHQSLEKFKAEVNKYLIDYLEDGLDYNRKLDGTENDNKEMEETLFFYPITGTITKLMEHLTKLKSGNN